MSQAARCGIRFRIPRRRGAADLRRAIRGRRHSAYSGTSRSGRRACCGRICPFHRQARGRAGNQRAGRDQCRNRYRRCLHGFDPHGGDHRTGAHGADRDRCLSGSGHDRPDAALHQAQLPRERPRAAGSDDRGSVPHRHIRPTRPRGRRYSERRADRLGELGRSGRKPPSLAPLSAPHGGRRR